VPIVSSIQPVPRVVIVGGGLAGLAAAAALATEGVAALLFEAKRRLGGRAGSFVDRQTGELVDHCQHVAMGCCTNFLDFCRRTGILGHFAHHRGLHFFGPDARRSDFFPWRSLPAPLHMVPPLWQVKHLSTRDKFAIARTLWKLIRLPPHDERSAPSIGQWLRERREPPAAIERFWQVILVSALGESLENASLSASRKVLLDGFVAHREAMDLYVPRVSLNELYDQHVAAWLQARGVTIHLETPVSGVTAKSVVLHHALHGTTSTVEADAVILAVPWRRAVSCLDPNLIGKLPELATASKFGSAPISSVHLWLDRPITDLPHAVIVGRLSQWIFARPGASACYQVVISASHELAGRPRQQVLDEVVADLRAIFPAARQANVERWQLITEPDAVFSVRPGLDHDRPAQKTAIPGLVLAGDWTATGWPATMEGAVRSGYLAAEQVLSHLGRPQRILVDDLPHAWLVRLLGIEHKCRRPWSAD
jgi:squalene-associated FAD-dependent desaturase